MLGLPVNPVAFVAVVAVPVTSPTIPPEAVIAPVYVETPVTLKSSDIVTGATVLLLILSTASTVSYTHLTLPTIYSV